MANKNQNLLRCLSEIPYRIHTHTCVLHMYDTHSMYMLFLTNFTHAHALGIVLNDMNVWYLINSESEFLAAKSVYIYPIYLMIIHAHKTALSQTLTILIIQILNFKWLLLIRFVCISNATDIFEKVSFSTNCKKEKKTNERSSLLMMRKRGFKTKFKEFVGDMETIL